MQHGTGLAMPGPNFASHSAASFGSAPMPSYSNGTSPSASLPRGVDSLSAGPAYVTPMASNFIVKNTFLELGPIGGPLRPIRSAAGRLDLLAGSDTTNRDDSEELQELSGSMGGASHDRTVGISNCTRCMWMMQMQLVVAARG